MINVFFSSFFVFVSFLFLVFYMCSCLFCFVFVSFFFFFGGGDSENIDNDTVHSFSQLAVHKALTCPDGQSAWALALSLFVEKLASCRNNLSWLTCADLGPPELEVGLYLRWKRRCSSLTLESVAGGRFAVL